MHDASKDNHVLVLRAQDNSHWVLKLGILALVLIGAAVWCYTKGVFGPSTTPETLTVPTVAAAPTEATPANVPQVPVAAVGDLKALEKENEIQRVARVEVPEAPNIPGQPAAVQTIPPPPPDDAKPEKKEDDGTVVIGQPAALGLAAVEIENYWVDDDKKSAAYAILSGYFQNSSNQPMTLPPIEVTLLDTEKRQYKPSKVTQNVSAKLNPLMKSKSVWFFELPPATPMYCAQFSTQQGKNKLMAYVKLGERTPENLKLMDDEKYQTEFVELMVQASPRVKAQGEYYKAKGVLDHIGEQLDDLEKQITKLDKKLKVATDAADSAKANAEKAKKDTEASKAWMKDIESSPAKFGHNARLQDIEYGKANTQAQRNARTEQTANETLKTKLDAKTKVDNEMKDLQTKLKNLMTKYEAQEKVAEKLKEKIE